METNHSNIVVSYYISQDDAINQVNRKTDSFPMHDTYKIGHDGFIDIQEVGINILEEYGLIDVKDHDSTIIMNVEPIE
jgi:hypothetical protein